VVRIVYEPAVVSFREILEVFFATHDPTTSNRQGNDIGTQYRSSVFYQDSRQKQAADETIAELTEAAVWKDPIVTEVVPAGEFYPAEEYHQQYFARNPYQPYCQFIVAPKLAKFREYFVGKLKSK
jgi:peptide-methionine (S)-S-oxide reductase